eukprot:scaffold4640_cov283-Chaetoceros_neogracile.AAC.14
MCIFKCWTNFKVISAIKKTLPDTIQMYFTTALADLFKETEKEEISLLQASNPKTLLVPFYCRCCNSQSLK